MHRFRSFFRILCGFCMIFFACPAWAGYVDNGNGTVTDTSTGLMWQRDAPYNLMSWEQALSYCENSTLAGYTDWRLPTRKELRSLLDYSLYPAINTANFPDTRDVYWSSTTSATDTASAWVVFFSHGHDWLSYKSGGQNVRAVRGGQLKCDVNGDKQIDLADGIMALQILSGMTPEGSVNLAADVDGDGKIGMAEATYIMRKAAGL